jgi:putative Mn2+ efflux pump MntP
MNLFSIVMIALALAMDAFAVSISSGITLKKVRLWQALQMAGFFGFFQAFMPVLGWLAGRWAIQVIQAFDHWIAFALLFFIGLKMIHDACRPGSPAFINPLKLSILFLLALSTSIDALAVGISLSFLKVDIIEPVLIIGFITFILSFAGIYIGRIFGHIFEKKLEIIGGLVLIGIGIKILFEHLTAHPQ